MVHYGKNITAKEDMLQKVPLSFIYKQINQPHEDLKSKIKQLRILRTMNSKQYNQLKKQLPYFVCGIFQPPYRKKENFGYTNYFIIDLDYLSDKEIALPNIKAKITQDPRVVMCFTSPSEDGLKIVFQL
ncbi:MAG TPA: BT4734/BF3469 family protein, partial [Bacteroidales bacterium]|nr:BT4734/BF3469 family protein [Bacteroidales bacterium]